MSLDVYLRGPEGEVYSANITHNLAPMARAAGIYECLWRPDEAGITKASQLVQPLADGLAMLVAEPTKFQAMDSPNGWGKWEHFVPFVAKYLEAARANPDASVSVSR